MANDEITEIIQCMKTLLMKNVATSNEEQCENVSSSCDQSSASLKCSCHESHNTNLDFVIKNNIESFFSHIENLKIKELIDKQGSSMPLSDCLCYGCHDNFFQPISCSCDVTWQLVVICLKALLALFHILKENEDEELNKKQQNNETHLPNIIGVKDQETVCSLIELVISFGLYPNLLPGIGRPMKPNCIPILPKSSDSQPVLSKANIHPRKILIIINVLLLLMKQKILHSLILSRNTSDIIASLIQLRYCPIKCFNIIVTAQCCCVSETNLKVCINCSNVCQHEKQWCETELDYILERSYQPLIIKELLILQRCSVINRKTNNKWFHKIIGHKLSKRMMQENGVKYVIQGILAGCNADSMNWKKYQSIGKLIGHVPSQVTNAEEYYKVVAPQVIKFLDMQDRSNLSQVGVSSSGSQYLMVTVACIQEMLELNYNFAKEYIFNPLLYPLLACFSSEGIIEVHGSEISRCISTVKQICSVDVDLGEKMLKILSGVIHPLFIIFCLHQHQYFRNVLCSLLVYLLHHLTPSDCIRCLDIFIFDNLPCDSSTGTNTVVDVVDKSAKYTIPCNQVVLDEKETVTVDDIPTDEKVSMILLLLTDKKLENVRGEFFVGLLKQLSQSLQCGKDNDKRETYDSDENSQELKEIDSKIIDIQHKIQLVSVISALLDTFEYTILQNTPQTVEFIKGILDLPWENNDGACLGDVGGFHEETVDLVLMLISFLLKTEKLTSSDFVILNTLVPSLQKASVSHSKESSRTLANDLKVYIATRGAVTPEDTSQQKPRDPRDLDLTSKEAYEQALKELRDPLLPTRGHALFQLSKLLKHRNKYAMKDREKLLNVFETNLAHHDTYLYLAAIEGLLFLVDVHHGDVLPLLCRKFAQFRDGEKEVKYSSELRMKLGEAIIKSCRICGDMLPHYSQLLLSALLTGVKDEDHLVRASSLSAVGDVCQLLKFSVGSIITEIVSCIRRVVSSDKSVEVRRAAIQVFALMFKGVGNRILKDIPDAVRDIYRLLQTVVASDEDELTTLHASNALTLLDEVVKDILFPKPVLEKKIQILG